MNLGVTLTVYLDFSTKTSGSRFKEAAELFSARAPWYLAKVTSMATQSGSQTLLKSYRAY